MKSFDQEIRYYPADMKESPDGEWVRFDDVAGLIAKVAAIKIEAERQHSAVDGAVPFGLLYLIRDLEVTED
jgi:hypothetical protein